MLVGLFILAGLLIMALTTEDPALRKRRLAIIAIMVLLAWAVRLLNVQF